MTWRDELPEQVRADFESALEIALHAACFELEENGYLPPVGVVVTSDGDKELAALEWSGRKVPSLEKMRAQLIEQLRAGRADYRTAGVARIVFWETANSKTIDVLLDHRGGITRSFLTPYTLKETPRMWGGPLREITLGEMEVRPAEPFIWGDSAS